jgi:hypothetical protein
VTTTTRAAGASDDHTARMEQIRALLDVGEMHQLLDVEIVTLAGDPTPHAAYQQLYREAPGHLAYLLDALETMQVREAKAREEAKAVWVTAARMQGVVDAAREFCESDVDEYIPEQFDRVFDDLAAALRVLDEVKA